MGSRRDSTSDKSEITDRFFAARSRGRRGINSGLNRDITIAGINNFSKDICRTLAYTRGHELHDDKLQGEYGRVIYNAT